jgi:hypothetical protein
MQKFRKSQEKSVKFSTIFLTANQKDFSCS